MKLSGKITAVKKEIVDSGHSKFLLALSGGPDSMFLLYLLIELRKEFSISFSCAHVNHGVRFESEEEERYLKEFCLKNDIGFYSKRLEKKSNANFQQDSRDFRYEFFDEIIRESGYDCLLTAHHNDDLIETILMRIIRGSTLKGYSGIIPFVNKESYVIYRPLLFLTKEEIFESLGDKKYFTDLSNYEEDYKRNRIRKNVLPYLKSEGLSSSSVMKYQTELNDYYNYVDKIVLELYSTVIVDNCILTGKIKKLDPFIISKIVEKYLLNYFKDELSLINDRHVEIILNAIYSEKSNLVLDLPNGNKLYKDYDKVFIVFQNIKKSFHKKELKFGLNNAFGYVFDISDKLVKKDLDYVCFDSSEVSLSLFVRGRRPGDIMKVLGLGGSKKVKDILIDEKISVYKRDNVPLVVDSDDNVLFIPNIKKSEFCKSKDEKYDIILWYQKEETYERY